MIPRTTRLPGVRKTGEVPFRWWIAGLLFASTTINYIDRQTLSVLAPYLKRDFGWSNSDFAETRAVAGGALVFGGRNGDCGG